MTRPLKPDRYRRMTLSELEPFVAQYHAQFPGWKRTFKEAFGRENGPIAQEIFFERLSYGTYRPASIIRFFVAPSGSAFHQFLAPPARESRPGEHDNRFPKIVEAMHKEIVPPVDGPLIPEDILRRYENQKQHRSPDAYHLAALNAYLGNEDRALHWCKEFVRLVEERGEYAWQHGDSERHAFLKQLEQWINTDEAKPRLEEVIQSERKRLKYV